MKQLNQITGILSLYGAGRVTPEDALLLIYEAAKNKGERAYKLREQGRPWKEIGKTVGSGRPHQLAETYAKHAGLQWPLPKMYVHNKEFEHSGKDAYEMRRAKQAADYYAERNSLARASQRVPRERIAKGGRYYEDRKRTGATWANISASYGLSPSTAYICARAHAIKNNQPWPI